MDWQSARWIWLDGDENKECRHVVFQRDFVLGIAAKEYNRNYSYSRVHLPFCISILKEYKEKD